MLFAIPESPGRRSPDYSIADLRSPDQQIARSQIARSPIRKIARCYWRFAGTAENTKGAASLGAAPFADTRVLPGDYMLLL